MKYRKLNDLDLQEVWELWGQDISQVFWRQHGVYFIINLYLKPSHLYLSAETKNQTHLEKRQGGTSA